MNSSTTKKLTRICVIPEPSFRIKIMTYFMEGTGTDPLLVNFPTFRLYAPLSYRGIYFQIVGINTNENKPFNIIVIQSKIPSTNPCYFSLFGGLREEKVRSQLITSQILIQHWNDWPAMFRNIWFGHWIPVANVRLKRVVSDWSLWSVVRHSTIQFQSCAICIALQSAVYGSLHLWKIAAFQILRKRNLTRFPRVQATIFIN